MEYHENQPYSLIFFGNLAQFLGQLCVFMFHIVETKLILSRGIIVKYS